MDEWRRSGQIPAFGNWDQANELPITQYFESARQAGLIRFSTTHNSSGECGHQDMRGDLYASDINKPSRNLPPPVKTRMREKRGTHAKEQRKQGKVCDVTEPARKQLQQPQPTVYHKNKISQYSHKMDTVIVAKAPVKPPKAIDEDLYKISPELLRSSKREKKPFIAKRSTIILKNETPKCHHGKSKSVVLNKSRHRVRWVAARKFGLARGPTSSTCLA